MFAKYQNVFRSRWKAVWWSAGILLTAYCTVPSAEETEHKEAKVQAVHHANPWALKRQE